MKLGPSIAIAPLLVGFFLVSCASQNETAEPVTERNRPVPVPKQGSNELKEMIEEVTEEVEAPAEETPALATETDLDSKQQLQIPLEVNERVEYWLKFFTERDRERFQRFLNRGETYKETIQYHLTERGIPTELYYLAMIESGFALHARSHASAVGAWQFIKGTGKRYGLEINSHVDERVDPMRSTHAAARYLADLHNVFQSWYLAMAAYNAGESRIMSAIMKNNSRDFWELAEKRALPKETMDYVPKFIAASIIGHNPERFGFTIVKEKEFPKLVAKTVPSRLKLSDIAAATNLPTDLLKQVNPHLLRGVTPPTKSNYEIWIPADQEAQFDEQQLRLASLPRSSQPVVATSGYKYHKVRRGETLGRIASRYGTSVAALRDLNGLRGSTIFVGRSLKVSGSDANAADAKESTRQSNAVHVVARGETLFKISKRYNLTMSYLKRVNKLKNMNVRAGQRLSLGAATAETSHPKRYTVRRGDSLAKIANKFGTSVSNLKRANKLRRNQIYAGQILHIAF